jgi:(2R)-ethylmalonyl-CoA mutase
MVFCAEHVPKWNPINICSYHLQEAGATPVQEIAFALATAVDVLDAVRDSGQVDDERFAAVVASVSFFVNAGIRFVEETCKMRAFTRMWDDLTRARYGIDDPRARRFRYGVQVNSLGLTAEQPENNMHRIGLELLGVTLSKDARARSIQLPAWNEALGLPRPWDQQWSLRLQQVLAHESDLLEYDDIFAGSHVIEAKTSELIEGAEAELDEIISLGGAFASIEELKSRLVRSHAARRAAIERGDLTVVGVNDFRETEPSPLGGAASILQADPHAEAALIEQLGEWRRSRDQSAFD